MAERVTETVAFGGGCFWCTEAVFLEIDGVVAVTPGYAGGTVANPTYEDVSTGATGHAEVILIEYDPNTLPFSSLLDVFFSAHDPTQKDRQGADVGTQYRSAIFYTTDVQRQVALEKISELERAGAYADPIVTEVRPLGDTPESKFFPAEAYHQRYYEKHPDAAYVRAVIDPKLEKVRAKHGTLLKADTT